MSLNDTIKDLIPNIFQNVLGGFTKDIVIKYYTSAGVYNAETDTNTPVFTDSDPITVTAVRTTIEDVKNHGAQMADTKLIVPAKDVAKPDTDTDKVVLDGLEWAISKIGEVPGDSIYLIFVCRK